MTPTAVPATSLAFAGAGRITVIHGLAAQASPGVTITKVASRTPTSAAERAGQMGAEPCTYAELPAGADVVFVASPPAQHAEHVIEALQGGAAVIVEKPLTTTLDDADRLVTAAAASGGRVGYAENLAFAPAVVLARTHLDALGAPHYIEARALSVRPDWGSFLTEGWGGGVLFDLGVHPIALVLLLAGDARPVSVSARLEGAADIPVDEHAEVTVTFDTGMRASITASWRHPDHVWDLEAASASGVVRVELLPNLALEVDGEAVAIPAPRPDLPAPQLEQMGYTGQLATFLADFAAGREPEMNPTFGRDVLDLVCGAYASAGHDGTPEPLPFTGPRDTTPLHLWRP